MSDHSPAVANLPTRVIGYAWGDPYIDELLKYGIPALLAPGNLLAVAAHVQWALGAGVRGAAMR